MELCISRPSLVRHTGVSGPLTLEWEEQGINHTPPHSMSGGAVDEKRRCKPEYPKELQRSHPQLKCLSSGAVDTGPITPPLTHWPTGQRMDHVDANPYFRGSFEHLSIGQAVGQRATGLSTRHTQKGCVCAEALQSIYSERGLLRVKTLPANPLVAGGAVATAALPRNPATSRPSSSILEFISRSNERIST
jgi:hypothetical protein